MKKVSLLDIARSLNVSTSLVSFVLNGQGDEKGINSKTQQRVLAKARELNYKPNHIARGLRLGKSNTIGLIVADISNKFYARIAKRVEELAGNNKYNLIICSTDENPEKEIELINMLRERQVDGLIISTTQNETFLFTQLKKEQFPFVLIDRQLSRIKTNYVGVENYSGAYNATDLLIRNGYSKIGLLKISPSYLSSVKEREKGYRDALKNHKLKVSNKRIAEIDYEDIDGQVKQKLIDFFGSPNQVNALFSVNNRITVACLECLKEMQIKVPEDVGLISFDDVELFRFSYPTITAVAQPTEKIGEEAVRLLFEIMNENQNGKIRQKILPVKIVERGSINKSIEIIEPILEDNIIN